MTNDTRKRMLMVHPQFMNQLNEKVKQLEAENAALRAAPVAGAADDMVLVPIELVRWAREMKLNYAADADSVSDSEACHRDADRLQACLDAAPVRVAGPNDAVIPTATIEKMVNDADFVAKAESLAKQHFPELTAALTGDKAAE